nr:MAG TPA: hypothetical protein [Bacteriophage sp.]DAX15215.1 MAG TPA: hypothetical protein [Bacteriophage sp.]
MDLYKNVATMLVFTTYLVLSSTWILYNRC